MGAVPCILDTDRYFRVECAVLWLENPPETSKQVDTTGVGKLATCAMVTLNRMCWHKI